MFTSLPTSICVEMVSVRDIEDRTGLQLYLAICMHKYSRSTYVLGALAPLLLRTYARIGKVSRVVSN